MSIPNSTLYQRSIFLKLALEQHLRFKNKHHISIMLFRILVFLFEFVLLSYAHLNISSLNCPYDYEDTMDCEFTSDMPLNCNAYSVDVESEDEDHFMCTFTNSSRKSGPLSRCGCTIKMLLMKNTEKYTRKLLEGGRVINTKIITALDNIKPRAPEILSVVPMKNGNYNITFKSHHNQQSILYEQLEIQLSYRKKGEPNTAWRTINASLPFQEIPGWDLEPNSRYIMKARSHSPLYETHYSDWSREVEWTVRKTGTDPDRADSIPSMWKMTIPVLSVCLIIAICASYLCWTRLKTQWWDMIPAPGNEIKHMLPGNAKVFTPKLYDPLSIHPNALTIAPTEGKSWLPPGGSECGVSYKNVSSGQPATDSSASFREDSETELRDSLASCGSSTLGYRNVLCPRSPGPPSPGATGPTALPAPAPGACPVCSDPGEAFQTLGLEALPPRDPHSPRLIGEVSVIRTDFQYRPCDGGLAGSPPTGGADGSCSEVDILGTLPPKAGLLTRVLPCRADDGYESFGDAIARAAQSDANFPACTLAPCEEGYQALQTKGEHMEAQRLASSEADSEGFSEDSLERCTGQVGDLQRGISHFVLSQFLPKTSSESPFHSTLNTPPIIETFIDCSYQRV